MPWQRHCDTGIMSGMKWATGIKKKIRLRQDACSTTKVYLSITTIPANQLHYNILYSKSLPGIWLQPHTAARCLLAENKEKVKYAICQLCCICHSYSVTVGGEIEKNKKKKQKHFTFSKYESKLKHRKLTSTPTCSQEKAHKPNNNLATITTITTSIVGAVWTCYFLL